MRGSPATRRSLAFKGRPVCVRHGAHGAVAPLHVRPAILGWPVSPPSPLTLALTASPRVRGSPSQREAPAGCAYMPTNAQDSLAPEPRLQEFSRPRQ